MGCGNNLHRMSDKDKAELLKTIWGSGAVEILGFIGSPKEGEVLDIAEIIIHELCHQVFLDIKCEIGGMNWTQPHMETVLDSMPAWKSDLHEIRAAAAELLVCRTIGIALKWLELRLSVMKGLRSKNSEMRVRRAVFNAQKTKKVKFAAAQVVALMEMQAERCQTKRRSTA